MNAPPGKNIIKTTDLIERSQDKESSRLMIRNLFLQQKKFQNIYTIISISYIINNHVITDIWVIKIFKKLLNTPRSI